MRPAPRLAVITEFLRSESAGGLMLILAAAAALIWANSPGSDAYEAMLHWVPPLPIDAATAACLGQRTR